MAKIFENVRTTSTLGLTTTVRSNDQYWRSSARWWSRAPGADRIIHIRPRHAEQVVGSMKEPSRLFQRFLWFLF